MAEDNIACMDKGPVTRSRYASLWSVGEEQHGNGSGDGGGALTAPRKQLWTQSGNYPCTHCCASGAATPGVGFVNDSRAGTGGTFQKCFVMIYLVHTQRGRREIVHRIHSAPAVKSFALATGCGGASDDSGCSYNGVAQPDGSCQCNPQWRGTQCATLNLIPTARDAGYQVGTRARTVI
jgi:hypothetical protein